MIEEKVTKTDHATSKCLDKSENVPTDPNGDHKDIKNKDNPSLNSLKKHFENSSDNQIDSVSCNINKKQTQNKDQQVPRVVTTVTRKTAYRGVNPILQGEALNLEQLGKIFT